MPVQRAEGGVHLIRHCMEPICRIFAAIVSTDLDNTPAKLYMLTERIVPNYTSKRVYAFNIRKVIPLV